MASKKRTPKAGKALEIEHRELGKLTFQASSPKTAGQRLPAGTVAQSGGQLTIDVAKLNRSLMRDQRARLVSSMGCVSNPGGPGC